MFNNCAGGTTPWGTWLTCEENFHGYFWGKLEADHPEARNYKRYGVPNSCYAWGKFDDRFDIAKEPNEANRFGWIVEIDPFAPASVPKKRTALGRYKHEGAAGIVNKDGRYVVYSGDDERFDYVYRFVTSGARRSRQPRRQPRHPRRRHFVGRQIQRRRLGGMAAAGAWPRPADRSQRLRQPGRRADRDAPRRRPARRHQDGPSGGRRGQPQDQQGLCRADQQQPAQARGAGRRQSARRQQVRPYHRDDAAGRRPRRRQVQMGNPGEVRRSVGRGGRRELLLRHHQERLVRHAGQRRASTAKAASGSRPTATPTRKPAAPTASGRWKPKAPTRGTSKHFFRVPGRRGAVRAGIHARRRNAVRRRSASGRRRRRSGGFAGTLRKSVDALAGLQARHAAASIGGGDHQARRRQDRELKPGCRRHAAQGSRRRATAPAGCPRDRRCARSSGAQTTRLRPACLAA